MAEEPRQGRLPRRRASQDVLPEPEPAHTNRSEAQSEDEREATELRSVTSTQHSARRRSRVLSPSASLKVHWYDPISKYWRHNINITVPHDDCRDHLANERTFLGYLRTSLALAMLGVIIAQLYRLQHVPTPDPVFGYYEISKPISCIFHVSAACVALLGSIRFFHQQHLMAIGKVKAGGWELMVIGVYVLLLLLAMFAVHVGITIYKD